MMLELFSDIGTSTLSIGKSLANRIRPTKRASIRRLLCHIDGNRWRLDSISRTRMIQLYMSFVVDIASDRARAPEAGLRCWRQEARHCDLSWGGGCHTDAVWQRVGDVCSSCDSLWFDKTVQLNCIIMDGDSEEFLLGNATLKLLGIDVNQLLSWAASGQDRARSRRRQNTKWRNILEISADELLGWISAMLDGMVEQGLCSEAKNGMLQSVRSRVSVKSETTIIDESHSGMDITPRSCI